MTIKIYENNDTVIEIVELRNSVTNALVTDATVVANVFKEGVDVSGDITLSYVSNSRGTYRGILPSVVAIASGDVVDVVISLDAAGVSAEFTINTKVRKRTE